ncbi:MAG: hypothetical protein EOM24_29685, partial [Chloroflexia bacterium]|nr:hypothetical protein [Chloroflexia bacterium]
QKARLRAHLDELGALFASLPAALLPITPELACEIQTMLSEAGYYAGPADGQFETLTRSALETYGGVENLEMRLTSLDENMIDPLVLDFMRRKQG